MERFYKVNVFCNNPKSLLTIFSTNLLKGVLGDQFKLDLACE